jgi:sensor histidine kinase YesM
MRRLIRAGVLTAAWSPMVLIWVLFGVAYAHFTLATAAARGLFTIGTAALLGIPVWRFCRRSPWPQRLRAGFYLLHFLLASSYAAAWILFVISIDALLYGRQVFATLLHSPVLGWQFLMGLWLYGLIAGISYAIATQERAQEQERRALRAEAGLNLARLDALRSRLHPHFLFNALHTIAALVREDAARTENAIEKLGEMLRYTLRDTPEETVPFAEEWEFTRRYLEFEELRYGDRLSVETTIGTECLACSTPPFALQTLVENAVRHSIATRPAGGKVEITVRADDTQLHVRVRDDGGDASPSTHDGSHFGLHALGERLSAAYGSTTRLSIETGPGGFAVSFSHPRLRAGDVDDE